MISLLLKNCKILENGILAERHLFLEDHKIAHISEDIIAADEVIDIKGKIVMPGVIDPHVHFREPGLTHKEDFLSGSMAAAKGGITTILDMPNTNPPTTTVELLNEKRVLAKKSVVNYGFHFGSTRDNIEEIKIAKNIPSVKVYMEQTTGDLRIDDPSVIEKIMAAASLCSFHSEGQNLARAIEAANKLNKKLYACHISKKEELQLIRKNKRRVFAEATPHHLFLCEEEDGERLGMLKHVKPSLNTKQDQEALWQALKSGFIDAVGSDHAPHLREEKLKQETYGFPGVETLLPLLLDAVNKGRLTLQHVTEITSKNAARIFGIKNKGMIKEGYDADLTVVDMELEREVKAEEMLSKSKWSPFEGKVLKGWPIAAFVNGELAYSEGKVARSRGKEAIFVQGCGKLFGRKDIQVNEPPETEEGGVENE